MRIKNDRSATAVNFPCEYLLCGLCQMGQALKILKEVLLTGVCNPPYLGYHICIYKVIHSSLENRPVLGQRRSLEL